MHLHTGVGEPPWELIKYRLRMMYRMTPEEFSRNSKGQFLVEMFQDMKCAAVDNKAQQFKG